MKRFVIFFGTFLFSLFAISAQEAEAIVEPSEESVLPEENSDSPSFFSQIDKSLFFTLGPKLMVNTDDHTKSAPSPIMYSLGVGGDFTLVNDILIQAHASFFTNYYLWDGEKAQPAEVENRTATALSAMIDLCSGYTFRLGQDKNHLLSFAAGAGFLLRHAILSNGVNSDDPNRDTSTTAGDDVSSINGTFFSDLNFLYPETAISYSFLLSEDWKIGGEFRMYFPLGSMKNGDGADGMIFSLAAKLSYK